jgi:Rieske Fe-S protein
MSEEILEPRAPRRRFLANCVRALLALVALIAVVSGIGLLFPSVRKRFATSNTSSPFQPICTVESLPPNEWQFVKFETVRGDWWDRVVQQRGVWVQRDGNRPDAIRVLSPECPHKGCGLNWRAEKSQFICPCHGGTFDANGNRKSGPPRRSMDPLDFRIEDGKLLIHWQDFQTDMAKRVAIEHA